MSIDENQKSTPVIKTKELWRTYRAGTHQEVHALQGVNLEIESGSYIALKGRSGLTNTSLRMAEVVLLAF